MRIRGKVKGLALVMALLMALNLVGYATAASTTVGSYDELSTAISDGSDRVTFSGDVELSYSPVKPFIISQKSVVIDLNGWTLVIPEECTFSVSGDITVTVMNGKILSHSTLEAFSLSNGSKIVLEDIKFSTSGTAFSANTADTSVQFSNVSVSFVDSLVKLGSSDISFQDGEGQPVDVSKHLVGNLFSVTSGSGDSETGSTGSSTGTSPGTQITVSVTGSYSLTVPATIDFGTLTYDDSANSVVTKTGTITLEHLVTAGDETVTVSVKGNGAEDAFVLKSGDRSIEYTVLDANSQTVDKGNTVATFTNPGEADFSVQLDKSNLRYSGDYTGSLIFTVNISE